jgi:tripartite-type tricarboxylate transporter receptor subunit TctC
MCYACLTPPGVQEPHMNRRKLLAGVASLAALMPGPSPVFAQGRYPDRPIRLIVPFAPGGATDVVGRLWADRIRPALGTVVSENKASGGGALGASEVARAQPDGYTFLFGNTSTQVLLPVLMSRPPYDPLKDPMPGPIAASSPTDRPGPAP